jgi:toxin ParE1/3/4
MANYNLTHKAIGDLSDIWNYTFDTWSEQQADEYYALLLNFFQKLAEAPKRGKKYPEVSPHLLGYSVHQHIIFYQCVSDHEIEVVRILHSRMDLRNRISD